MKNENSFDNDVVINNTNFTFEYGGKHSYFGIKNGKWTFWTDDENGLDVDSSAKEFFECFISEYINKRNNMTIEEFKEILKEFIPELLEVYCTKKESDRNVDIILDKIVKKVPKIND